MIRLSQSVLAALLPAALLCNGVHALEVKGLSTTINACDDFYAYANGDWLANTQIAADRSRVGVFSDIRDRNDALIKAALTELSAGKKPAKNPSIAKAVDYFASGMDEAGIERADLKPLEPTLKAIEGLRRHGDLPRLLGELHRNGFTGFFQAEVVTDARDRTRYWIGLEQAGLGLPERDYYLDDKEQSRKTREQYVAHIARMLALGGASGAASRQQAARIMQLETAMAGKFMPQLMRRNPLAVYNPAPADQLKELAPGFDWSAYFSARKLKPGEKLNIAQPDYFKAVAGLVAGVPPEDVRAYLRWHALRLAAPYLPQRFIEESFAFNGKVLDGREALRPRAERVIEDMSGRVGSGPLAEALGQLYVERAFSPQAKVKAVEMTGYIKAALADRIRGLDWMADSTKTAALKKLDAMVLKIGYPDTWRDYSALTIKRGAYLENWLAGNRFMSDLWAGRMGKPVDRKQWWMAPHIVNAYAGQFNEIVFPAGILQPPFFNPDADPAANFGAIGMVIGHEIIHHFDDRGRQFDELGNLREWWTAEDAARYKARAQALVEQFNGFKVGDLNANGQLTLGENIADLSGLRMAYLGLQRHLKDKPVAKIDGLTQEQRFFIAFAQSWRDRSRPEAEVRQTKTGQHSLPRFRVKGPVSNLPEFGKAFECKPGAVALRDEPIVIW